MSQPWAQEDAVSRKPEAARRAAAPAAADSKASQPEAGWKEVTHKSGEKSDEPTTISGAAMASISCRMTKTSPLSRRFTVSMGRVLQQHLDSANKPAVNRTVPRQDKQTSLS